MTSVFLVEDDKKLNDLVADFLRGQDYDVTQIFDGSKAVYKILREKPDLVILDIMLPEMDGVQVCRSVRHEFEGQILMLTAKEDDETQIEGIKTGADDYVKKPVQPEVLLARVKMLLRREKQKQDKFAILEFGNLKINQAARNVKLKGEDVDLPDKEFDLLVLLAMNAGKILSRDAISIATRGMEFDGVDRSIDMRIVQLRKKMGDDHEKPERIKTVWGKGYMLSPDAWE